MQELIKTEYASKLCAQNLKENEGHVLKNLAAEKVS